MRLFLCFFVFAVHVLLTAVISRVLAWFWVGFGKIAFFLNVTVSTTTTYDYYYYYYYYYPHDHHHDDDDDYYYYYYFFL